MDNKSAGKDLALFLAGIFMCAGGVYLFLSNVDVSTSMFGAGGGINFWGLIGGNGIPTGMITIPLIIGIVMLFFAPNSVLSKIVTALGLLIIILGVISSTTLRFRTTNAFNYVLMVILIFGGAAMILRILLVGTYSDKTSEKYEKKEARKKSSKSVDDMLEEMKNDM